MLKIYNTQTRKKQNFKPLKDKKINIFVCGPTVYDYSHIGHAKTYVQFDVIVKYLRYKGYKVFYLQNITDIDDKIIKRAKELNLDPKSLAKEYESYYHEDMKSLNVNSVTKYAKATGYIKEITSKGDFCLWKFSKMGEPVWKSKIGDGRSGWHIEDTAITESFFGPQYDIHGGAKDLIFPHHEAEIAQMESISGKK